MPYYDYLIVGQGISGTMLAHFLLKKGKRIFVVDRYNPSSASNVAAGLINPVTGKRFVKTWMASSLHHFAEQTYRELEDEFSCKFWHTKNIVKALSGEEEYQMVQEKMSYPDYRSYILPLNDNIFPHLRLSKACEIKHAGHIDLAELVSRFRYKLISLDLLAETTFTINKDDFGKNPFTWNGMEFGRIVFCEGHNATNNPLFSWLPFVPAKGEVLTIFCEQLNLDDIVIKDIFILPLENGYYKVGSTYQWDRLDETPTQEGRQELLRKLENLLDCSYSVISHLAGIRPTVKDRRPLLGMHPIHTNIGILNGLGTKGASLAPYFANHMCDFLEGEKPLDKEVDIARFVN